MIDETGKSSIVELTNEQGQKYGVHDTASGYRVSIWHGDKVRLEGKRASIADLTPEQATVFADLLVRMRDILALPATN